MSDEPEQNKIAETDDRMPDPWVMPAPVFRSTEGTTPKSAEPFDDDAHLDETLRFTPEGAEDAVPGIAAEVPEAAAVQPAIVPVPETAQAVRVKAAAPKAKSGSWAMRVLAILLIILIAVAAVAAAIVYLFYSTPPPDPFQ